MGNDLSIPAKLYLMKEVLFKGANSFQTVMSSMGGNPGTRDTSQKSMIEAYAYMPWLRAAFGKVSEGISSSAWYLEAASKKQGRKKTWVKNSAWANAGGDAKKAMRKVVLRGATIEPMYDHVVMELLSNPNPLMSGSTLNALTILHVDLAGEAIWWLNMGKNGSIPESIWPIPPHWITHKPTTKEPYFELDVDGFPKKIPIEEVAWFRMPDPAAPYTRTVGVAGPLADELEADEYAAQHVKAWFLNRARPDILISGTGLSVDEAERAEERWLEKLGGFWRAHRPHFVGAEVKVAELTGKFTDMQLIELRKWQRDIVLQAVGLPPEILGVLESSNRATIDSANFILARWVLTPRLELLRSVIQSQVLPFFDDKLVINFVSPIEEDREFKLSVYKASPWAHTINDWRDLAGDNELANEENGDFFMVPAAYVPTRSDDLENYESPYTAQQAGRPEKEDE